MEKGKTPAAAMDESTGKQGTEEEIDLGSEKLALEEETEILDKADVTAAVCFGWPNPHPEDPKMCTYYQVMMRLFEKGDARFDSEMYENDRGVRAILYPPDYFDD